MVHVDAAKLKPAAEGRCELADVPSFPVETACRLACDASIVTITADEQGEPLDVGRKTRSIPSALRRALEARDRGCVFPGCIRSRYVDGDHLTLCRFHHRAVHEGGVRVERLDDGARRFTRPPGKAAWKCPYNAASCPQRVHSTHRRSARIHFKRALAA